MDLILNLDITAHWTVINAKNKINILPQCRHPDSDIKISREKEIRGLIPGQSGVTILASSYLERQRKTSKSVT
jgi:hypothetical protein